LSRETSLRTTTIVVSQTIETGKTGTTVTTTGTTTTGMETTVETTNVPVDQTNQTKETATKTTRETQPGSKAPILVHCRATVITRGDSVAQTDTMTKADKETTPKDKDKVTDTTLGRKQETTTQGKTTTFKEPTCLQTRAIEEPTPTHSKEKTISSRVTASPLPLP